MKNSIIMDIFLDKKGNMNHITLSERERKLCAEAFQLEERLQAKLTPE